MSWKDCAGRARRPPPRLAAADPGVVPEQAAAHARGREADRRRVDCARDARHRDGGARGGRRAHVDAPRRPLGELVVLVAGTRVAGARVDDDSRVTVAPAPPLPAVVHEPAPEPTPQAAAAVAAAARLHAAAIPSVPPPPLPQQRAPPARCSRRRRSHRRSQPTSSRPAPARRSRRCRPRRATPRSASSAASTCRTCRRSTRCRSSSSAGTRHSSPVGPPRPRLSRGTHAPAPFC